MRPPRRGPSRRQLLAAASTATLLLDLPAQTDPTDLVGCETTRQAILQWLQQLDQAFARRDLDGYLGRFAPDHQGHHELLRQRLAGWLLDQPARSRTSTLRGKVQEIGPRLVAWVQHQVASAIDTVPPFTEQAFVVFRRDGQALRPTLEVELPETYEPCDLGMPFACPPCNYQIGGVGDWLCVPVFGERGRALEGVSFLLLGTDVSCELQVDVHGEPWPAATRIEHLTTTASRMPLDLHPGPVLPWQPTAMAARPTAFTAAQRQLGLPGDQRAHLFVACLGTLSHTLLLRGSAATWAAHQPAIDDLLASYRLLDTGLDRAQAAAKALATHTRSSLVGTRFGNDRFRIEFEGPAAWQPSLRAGSCAFQCIWACPQRRGRLWLTGYLPSRGLTWTTEAADRLLQDLSARAQLSVDQGDDHGWQAVGNHRQRTLVLSPTLPRDGQPRRRHLRAFLHDDLLVIADGFALDDDDAIVHRALDSYVRH